MRKLVTIVAVVLLASVSSAGDNEKHELRMSLDDTFVVEETDELRVDVKKILSLRYAHVNITPKNDKSFDMQLYFKCDTPDFAQFDSSEKIKKSVISSSMQYLPHIVEKKFELKELSAKGWYGWYTVLTDAKLANRSTIPNGEFRYLTRGMVRLSPDSALGFSLMTNELDTPKYNELFDYICSFIKEKSN